MKDFIKIQEAIMKVARRTPTLVGGMAVNFFKERFRYRNWLDKRREPWPTRNPEDDSAWGRKKQKKNRALLVQTGRLRRSIRVVAKTQNTVAVGTDVPYAKAHNEGYEAQVTQRVKAHQVRAHKRKIRGEKRSIRAHERKAFSRTINQKVPARPFMGESHFLNKKIEREIERTLKKELRFLKHI